MVATNRRTSPLISFINVFYEHNLSLRSRVSLILRYCSPPFKRTLISVKSALKRGESESVRNKNLAPLRGAGVRTSTLCALKRGV